MSTNATDGHGEESLVWVWCCSPRGFSSRTDNSMSISQGPRIIPARHRWGWSYYHYHYYCYCYYWWGVCEGGHMLVSACLWGSEDNFGKSDFSFHNELLGSNSGHEACAARTFTHWVVLPAVWPSFVVIAYGFSSDIDTFVLSVTTMTSFEITIYMWHIY